MYFQVVVLEKQEHGRLLKEACIGQWNIKTSDISNEVKKKNQTTLKYWNLLQQLPSLTTAHLLIDAAHEHTGNSRSGLILGVTDIELYLSLLLLPLKGEIDVSACGVIMRRIVRQEYCSLLSTNKRHNIWLSASNYFLTIPVLKLIVVIIFVLRHIEAVPVMLSLGDETNVRWKNELWCGPGKFK